MEESLNAALDLLSDCSRAYGRATDTVRRLYNQAFFETILITDGDVRAVLAEPFRTLIGPEVIQAALADAHASTDDADDPSEEGPDRSPDAWTPEHLRVIRAWPLRAEGPGTKRPAPSGAGWKRITLVPTAGFEPAAHGLGNRCSIP